MYQAEHQWWSLSTENTGFQSFWHLFLFFTDVKMQKTMKTQREIEPKTNKPQKVPLPQHTPFQYLGVFKKFFFSSIHRVYHYAEQDYKDVLHWKSHADRDFAPTPTPSVRPWLLPTLLTLFRSQAFVSFPETCKDCGQVSGSHCAPLSLAGWGAQD